jgi:Recombinase/Recombinase zinc beta ribbon domain
LVFRKVQELGTVRQTLRWFLGEGLQVPAQTPRGELTWRRPSYRGLYRMITHPVYGGAYAYGKTEQLLRYEKGKPGHIRRGKPRERWLALIPNAHEGYVSWEEFERIQQMIRENGVSADEPGVAKHGPALLAGLLRCRRCGRKLTVRYTGSRHDVLRYACNRGWLDNGEPRCIAFGGVPVDDAITEVVLEVVQPAAVEAAMLASEEEAHQRDDVLETLRRELEAARYAAQRAQRQYDASDPENRLVAGELECRWNLALQQVREIETRIEQHSESADPCPTATPEEFAGLARQLEAVWNDSETDVRLKKRIIRTLIREVIAEVDGSLGEVILVIHWKGGVHTERRVPRRRRGQNNSHTPKGVVEAVATLARLCSDDLIAGMLNRNGLKTGRGNRWTRERVTALRSHYRILCYNPQQHRELEGWMNLTEAAAFLKVSPRTLRLAVDCGEIVAEHPLPDGPWVFHRQALETAAARALVHRVRQGHRHPAIPSEQQSRLHFSST